MTTQDQPVATNSRFVEAHEAWQAQALRAADRLRWMADEVERRAVTLDGATWRRYPTKWSEVTSEITQMVMNGMPDLRLDSLVFAASNVHTAAREDA
jgi:hypothetical protein